MGKPAREGVNIGRWTGDVSPSRGAEAARGCNKGRARWRRALTATEDHLFYKHKCRLFTRSNFQTACGFEIFAEST